MVLQVVTVGANQRGEYGDVWWGNGLLFANVGRTPEAGSGLEKDQVFGGGDDREMVIYTPNRIHES